MPPRDDDDDEREQSDRHDPTAVDTEGERGHEATVPVSRDTWVTTCVAE